MSADDDYEILSHKDVEKLRGELKTLRTPNKPSEDSIRELSEMISNLIDIFKETSLELKAGESDFQSQAHHIKELSEKMDVLIDQNEKIADAILSLADKVETKEEDKGPSFGGEPEFDIEPPSTPAMPSLGNQMPPPSFGRSSMPPPPNSSMAPPPIPSMAPPPMSSPPPQGGPFNPGSPPPPPPPPPQKKSLFKF